MKNAIKVLVVDDDKASSQMLSEVVKRLGFKAIVANKPVEALNIAKLQSVQAAIIDVLLPKMSGVDLAEEFRSTQFADNPIILVSGIFKDKSFASEAIHKSGAVDFLFKPFSVEELTESLKKSLSKQMTTEKWTVESLLMRQFKSARDRSKAIERLETLRGPEFPLVLSILMEAAISGDLNIVNNTGEIFGISLAKGTIAAVDSSESQSTGVLALIEKGFLAQEDWDDFQAQGMKRFTLERLVQEGLVSPHAVSVAQHQQIIYDFKSICASESLQINFVPQFESEDPPKHAVTMKEVLRLLATSLDEFFPESYLKEFYKGVQKSAMMPLRSNEDMDVIWRSKSYSQVPALREAFESGQTLEFVLKRHPEETAQVYSGLHYLVLSRCLIFSDPNQERSFKETEERYRKLFTEIKSLSPDQVFTYFGAKDGTNPIFAEKIYAEYLMANDPGKLPNGAPVELVELVKQCHDIIDQARKTLLDPESREKLLNSIKEEGAQRVRKAKELTATGLDLLRKGQFENAISSFRQAEAQSANATTFMLRSWAEIKSGAFNDNKNGLNEILRQMERFAPEDKRSVYYHMVAGLVKKALGDPAHAASFERVLQLDPTFVEARRELNAPNKDAATKKVDFLHGDITEIVSGLFRRKA